MSTDVDVVAIRPEPLDEGVTRMHLAGFGDGTVPTSLPTGVCQGDQAQEFHEWPGRGKSSGWQRRSPSSRRCLRANKSRSPLGNIPYLPPGRVPLRTAPVSGGGSDGDKRFPAHTRGQTCVASASICCNISLRSRLRRPKSTMR